jgi:beta-lactamase superfamily II metal-dependent hydrolase
MAIPSPESPSSISPVSAVRLNPTLNNRAFYVFSGDVAVDGDETTMISIGDIGKRDILLCLELGSPTSTSADYIIRVKSNGEQIMSGYYNASYQPSPYGYDELKLILPANTSLEVTLQGSSGTTTWNVAGYGYYMEAN